MSTEQQESPEVELTDDAPAENVEIPVEEAPQEQPSEQINEAEKAFNPKTDKVDFTTPEQQARFNEVYRQVQKSDQRNAMLTEFLSEAVKQIEDLKGVTKEIKNEKAQAQEQEA